MIRRSNYYVAKHMAKDTPLCNFINGFNEFYCDSKTIRSFFIKKPTLFLFTSRESRQSKPKRKNRENYCHFLVFFTSTANFIHFFCVLRFLCFKCLLIVFMEKELPNALLRVCDLNSVECSLFLLPLWNGDLLSNISYDDVKLHKFNTKSTTSTFCGRSFICTFSSKKKKTWANEKNCVLCNVLHCVKIIKIKCH